MKTILAAIDFSPVTRAVIEEAVRLAKLTRGRLVLMHAVHPRIVATDLETLAVETADITAALEREAERNLGLWRARLARRGVAARTLCERGVPGAVIPAKAAALKARYLVVGSHGHTAFFDFVVGSVAGALLKRSPCAVVVVPAEPRAAS